MAIGAVAIEVTSSEVFARRPRSLLPARIGCAAVSSSPGARPARCGATAATAADVVCRSCASRRVFLCDACVEEIRWGIQAGTVWCAIDGGPITGADVALSLAD